MHQASGYLIHYYLFCFRSTLVQNFSLHLPLRYLEMLLKIKQKNKPKQANHDDVINVRK